MPKPIVDVTDQKFGRLTALRRLGLKSGQARWECICECGVIKSYGLSQLKGGKTKSCGCLQKELTIQRSTIHGHSTREDMSDTYVIWCGIKTRCFNENEPAYKNYGARGITMCDRWKDSFENFLEDMGERPSKKHSIDRIDNEKGYEPGNCKWATRAEQARNNRRNVWIEYNGKKMVLTDWAKEYNIPMKTLRYRLQTAKWTIEKALTTPIKGKTN
jgi:hypothetical protein